MLNPATPKENVALAEYRAAGNDWRLFPQAMGNKWQAERDAAKSERDEAARDREYESQVCNVLAYATYMTMVSIATVEMATITMTMATMTTMAM